MISYSKLPYFAQLRICDCDDVEAAYQKFAQGIDINDDWGLAWDSISEKRQTQILKQIRNEMQRQLNQMRKWKL